MADKTVSQSEELLNEVRDVISQAEDLVDNAGIKDKLEAMQLKEKLQKRLQQTKNRLYEVEEEVTQRAKVACKATDDYVRENPYKAIGVTAGVAFLVGLLCSRR